MPLRDDYDDLTAMVSELLAAFPQVAEWEWHYFEANDVWWVMVRMVDNVYVNFHLSDYILEWYLQREQDRHQLKALLYDEIAYGLEKRIGDTHDID